MSIKDKLDKIDKEHYTGNCKAGAPSILLQKTVEGYNHIQTGQNKTITPTVGLTKETTKTYMPSSLEYSR